MFISVWVFVDFKIVMVLGQKLSICKIRNQNLSREIICTGNKLLCRFRSFFLLIKCTLLGYIITFFPILGGAGCKILARSKLWNKNGKCVCVFTTFTQYRNVYIKYYLTVFMIIDRPVVELYAICLWLQVYHWYLNWIQPWCTLRTYSFCMHLLEWRHLLVRKSFLTESALLSFNFILPYRIGRRRAVSRSGLIFPHGYGLKKARTWIVGRVCYRVVSLCIVWTTSKTFYWKGKTGKHVWIQTVMHTSAPVF